MTLAENDYLVRLGCSFVGEGGKQRRNYLREDSGSVLNKGKTWKSLFKLTRRKSTLG